MAHALMQAPHYGHFKQNNRKKPVFVKSHIILIPEKEEYMHGSNYPDRHFKD